MSYDADSFKAGFALGRMLWRPPTKQATPILTNWIIANPGLLFGKWSNNNSCTLVSWTPSTAVVYAAAWLITDGRMWTPVMASRVEIVPTVVGGNGVVSCGIYGGYHIYSVNGQTPGHWSDTVYTYTFPAQSEQSVISQMVEDLP